MNVNVTRSLILGLLLVSPPLMAQPVLEEPLAETAALPASSLDGPAFRPNSKSSSTAFDGKPVRRQAVLWR
ncbi:hypothetical protein DK37_21655 [Halomonas sp. SUBG004]|nr:hypothetical protein DK37_21655 [Halomonas sp. SUBG004]